MNCQVVVDHQKKVLWASYSHRGASHDSTCFRKTKLYDVLKQKQHELFSKGLFLLGDSAYAIESFIIPPYDSVRKKTEEDNFNFYHSSARITVECAFGEISMRWAIFGKRLISTLDNNAAIIEGAMHLHNYLVDYRNSLIDLDQELNVEETIFNNDRNDNRTDHVVVGNDNHRGSGGRPTNMEKQCRLRGMQLRNSLKTKLALQNLERPD